VLIAFSRLYLGVHFPQDVVAGLAIGAVFLSVWLWGEPRVRSWLSDVGLGWQVGLALLIPLGILILLPGEDTAAAMGSAIGMGIGAALERQTVRSSVSGKMQRRVLRGTLGLALMLAIYAGLSALFSLVHLEGSLELAWRALRYALLGFAGGWGAPWVFVQTRLANRDEGTSEG
jgi:hypothetical protein